MGEGGFHTKVKELASEREKDTSSEVTGREDSTEHCKSNKFDFGKLRVHVLWLLFSKNNRLSFQLIMKRKMGSMIESLRNVKFI